MIDIYNQIFEIVATALETSFPNIVIMDSLETVPSSFPAVVIEEADNYVNQRTSDSGNIENTVKVMYEIDVFTNKAKGKKSQAKQIHKVIDEILGGFNFRRMNRTFLPMADNTTLRLHSNYTAEVDSNNNIYRG